MSDRDRTGPTTVLERDDASRLPVDPRLRARRIEVARGAGRRRLRRLVVLAAFTVLCAAAWGITQSPLLDVDHVEVTGADQTGASAVVEAGGIGIGDPLIDVDLGRAEQAINALPWVDSVAVTRSWWGTIEYRIVERVPVAVLRHDTMGNWLVDAGGWVLAPVETSGTGAGGSLVSIDATPALDAIMAGAQVDSTNRRAVDVAGALTPGLVGVIDAVIVDETGELTLRLRPEITAINGREAPDPGRVRLGDARALTAQLVAAETVLARVQLECLAVLDVRVAASPVVTRDAQCDQT